MKKSCVFTLATILTVPAFAAADSEMYGKDVTTVYGETPTETLNADAVPVDNTVIENQTNPDIKFPRGMQLGLGISATSGLDGFIGYNNKKFDSFWWKRLGVRVGYASTKPVKSFINKTVDRYMGDGVDIGDHLTVTDGKITGHQIFAVLDFYPFGDTWFFGGWRISGGYYNGELDVTANLTTQTKGVVPDELVGREFQLGNVWYKYNGGDARGMATAKWDYSGPYAGLGFDLGLFSGLKIYFDAGVVFTDDAAKLDLQINDVAALQQSTDRTTWTPVNTDDFAVNKANVLYDAQHKLDKYPYYPIVKMGFMYRF